MKNKWVSFLSKLAFICNLCFLFGLVILNTRNFINNQPVEGTIVILGTFGALLINSILQLCLLFLRITKKDIPVAAWLRIFNVAVFAIQIIRYFLMPGN